MKRESLFLRIRKIIILALFVLTSFYKGYSQDHHGFEYTYDNAGNRTERMFIILKSGETTSTPGYVADTVSITDRAFDLEFILHPNPTKSIVQIEISGNNYTILKFSLYTLQGSLISNIQQIGTSAIIDLSNQPRGMYILVCQINNQQKEWKIIKE